MSNTLERLTHRYRICKNLGLEDDTVIIAVQIAEQVQKEMESVEYGFSTTIKTPN